MGSFAFGADAVDAFFCFGVDAGEDAAVFDEVDVAFVVDG